MPSDPTRETVIANSFPCCRKRERCTKFREMQHFFIVGRPGSPFFPIFPRILPCYGHEPARDQFAEYSVPNHPILGMPAFPKPKSHRCFPRLSEHIGQTENESSAIFGVLRAKVRASPGSLSFDFRSCANDLARGRLLSGAASSDGLRRWGVHARFRHDPAGPKWTVVRLGLT